MPPNRRTPILEGDIRRRIATGLKDRDDYHTLAGLLYSARQREVIKLIEDALNLDLPEVQEAIVSALAAWSLSEFSERQSEALRRAQASLTSLPQDSDDPMVLFSRGIAHLVNARCATSSDSGVATEETRLALDAFEQVRLRSAEAWMLDLGYEKVSALFLSMEQIEEAMQYSEKRLELPLTDLEHGLNLVDYAWWLSLIPGREVRTSELAQAAIQILPRNADNPQVHLYRGLARTIVAHRIPSSDTEIEAKLAREGIEDFEKALAHSPSTWQAQIAYYQGALLHLDLDESEEVIQSCKRCLQLDLAPVDRLRCLILLGEVLRDTGDLDEAGRFLKEALGLIDADISLEPKVYNQLGLVELDRQHFSEARDHFHNALEVLRGTTGEDDLDETVGMILEASVHLAEACHKLGRYEEAISACEAAVRLGRTDDTYHWHALLRLGKCYLAVGSHMQSKHAFEEVLKSSLTPEDQELARNGIKGVHNTLAESHYDSREYSKAAAEYEQILELHTDDDDARCTILLSLAHCRTALGDHQGATACYQTVSQSAGATAEQKRTANKALSGTQKFPWFPWRQ